MAAWTIPRHSGHAREYTRSMHLGKSIVAVATTPARIGLAATEASLNLAGAGLSLAKQALGDNGGSRSNAMANMLGIDDALARANRLARLLDDDMPLGRAIAQDGPMDRLLRPGGLVDLVTSPGGLLDRLTAEGGGLQRALQPGGLADRLLAEDGMIDRLLAEDGVAERLLAEGGLIDRSRQRTGHSNSSPTSLTPSVGWRPGWRRWSPPSPPCKTPSPRSPWW